MIKYILIYVCPYDKSINLEKEFNSLSEVGEFIKNEFEEDNDFCWLEVLKEKEISRKEYNELYNLIK